jgi:hypothetical protein
MYAQFFSFVYQVCFNILGVTPTAVGIYTVSGSITLASSVHSILVCIQMIMEFCGSFMSLVWDYVGQYIYTAFSTCNNSNVKLVGFVSLLTIVWHLLVALLRYPHFINYRLDDQFRAVYRWIVRITKTNHDAFNQPIVKGIIPIFVVFG